MFSMLGPRDIFGGMSNSGRTQDGGNTGATTAQIFAAVEAFCQRFQPGQRLVKVRCGRSALAKLRFSFSQPSTPNIIDPLGSVVVEEAVDIPDIAYEMVFADGSTELVLPGQSPIRREAKQKGGE